MRKALLLVLAFVTIGSTLPRAFAAVVPPVPSTIVPTSTEPDSASVNGAINEFKSLSRSEKKERLKDVKKEWKKYKKAKKAGDPDANKILLVILAILLPPLAVYLHQGVINTKFWISLLLCLLAIFTFFLWIIPVVYALLVVLDAI
ncbi:MAG TPA: YqaE/Pmp3 family membrane protein [Chitinophagaceae bacterium]|jgi:uncharacterized membrane protein YqaE (UPF0057 family)|nr:YqaE/Pmp3 family membrane protein [Chitinophagaceae bacterium]